MTPHVSAFAIFATASECFTTFVAALLPSTSSAQGASSNQAISNELARRCWANYAPQRTKPASANEGSRSVGFSNLRDGYRVYSPFKVEFAVRGMGVAPAGTKLEGAGHHHILIDRPLPKDVSAALPFDEKHKHFGKGQTSTVLDLPPGKHTLRLLFADHEHRPYYVFSDQITVEVVAPRSALLQSDGIRIDRAKFDTTCAAWYQNTLTEPSPGEAVGYFLNVRDGDVLQAPFNVRLGTEGYGVCSAEIAAEKSGHFIVEARQGKQLIRKIELRDGRTQTELDLRAGDYELRAILVDSAGRSLGAAHAVSVRIDPTRRSD